MTNIENLAGCIIVMSGGFFLDDHTRVVLSADTKQCDYINANYIKVSSCNRKKVNYYLILLHYVNHYEGLHKTYVLYITG